jgi:hypothetical protein
MFNCKRHLLRCGISLVMSSTLIACATGAARPPAGAGPAGDWPLAAQALLESRWSDAQPQLARLLQQDLANGHLQFLHAYSVEQRARREDRAQLEQAQVGYENAVRFAPGYYWSLLHLGFLALERGDHAGAQSRFAEAAMDQPQRWEAFYGLGVASYFRRDLPLLQLAAQRVQQLAPDQVDGLRLAALAQAVSGDPAAITSAQRSAALESDPAQGRYLLRRVAEYSGDPGYSPADFYDAETPDVEVRADVAAPESVLSQVVVEVTILLSSVLDQANRGVNLFDGLRVLYGYTNTLSQTVSSLGRDSTRSITSQISTPQLDYSLNLFNDSGQSYSVVARPSILPIWAASRSSSPGARSM